MATWKKVIVSGSSIAQLNNDANLIYSNSADVKLSGSFSGSYSGDGSGLTGVSAAGTISSSAQIADDISGSLGANAALVRSLTTGTISGSLGANATLIRSLTTGTISGSLGANATLIRSLTAASISGSITTTSASIATAIATNSASIAALDADFATDVQVGEATASLSASLATDIAALEAFTSSLSATAISYSGSFAGDGSALEGITVTQNATVTASYSSALTASITHNFDSDNILVSAYDADGYQFIPGQVFLKTNDIVELHFESATTGKAVVARGGHIVSGSIPFDNIIAKPALISSSAQIAADISGSSTSLSSSLASRVTTAEAELGNTLISSSAQIAGDISGSLGANATLVRGLTAAKISGSFTSTSASIASDIADISTTFTVDANSGTADDIPSGETLTFTGAGPITTVVSANEITIDVSDAVISGSFTATSASIASDIATLDTDKAAKTAVSGAFAAASASFSTRVTDNEGDLAAIETYTGSLKNAITVSGQNVTVAGNLEVSGTTTTVDSTTVSFSDNIIELNGTGAANGGINVNDANGPASGSLLWDGTANHWKAGGEGSEAKILTKGGNDGLLSGSAQIAADISGSITATSASIATDIVTKADKTAVSGAFATTSSSLAGRITANEAFSSSLDNTFTTTVELLAATASLSASLATSIATKALTANISGSFTSTSASIASDIATLDTDKANKTGISGSLGANATLIRSLTGAGISGSLGANATLIRSLTAATISGSITATSASIATDIAALESFSSSLDASFATEVEVGIATASLSSSIATNIATKADKSAVSGAFTSVSASIASSIGSLEQSKITTGSHELKVSLDTGSAVLVSSSVEILEFGDIYNQSGGQIDFRVPASAGYIELNHGDSDFIWLDGTDAGITLDNNFEWRFYQTGTFIAPGEIRGTTISGSVFKTGTGEILSSSAQLNTITGVASAISGAFSAPSASISTRITAAEAFSSSLDNTFTTEAELVAATASLSSSLASGIATNKADIDVLEGKSIISASTLAVVQQGEVRLSNNGVAGGTIDLGLQTTDTPTFAGLTIAGDLTVTGNTVEAQVTNLNIEDKYILLNSGSTSGDSGIVFGGANGAANTGVGLFWDTSYKSNDGRLGIVNTIAGGATADQTPAYHIAGVFEGTAGDSETAQADHVGNIRVESDEIYIYV